MVTFWWLKTFLS